MDSLDAVVLIDVRRGENCVSVGAGFCARGYGLIMTAFHVVCDKSGGPHKGAKIRVLFYDDVFRDAKYVGGYPAQDIALLRVLLNDGDEEGKTFPCIELGEDTSTVFLRRGEPLVAHGHTRNYAFSSKFGRASYNYQTVGGHLDKVMSNLNLTLKDMSAKKLIEARKNSPTPRWFRTVAGCVSMKRSTRDLRYLHPHLPLIQESGMEITYSFSGTPVFKENDSLPVGVLCFSPNFYSYIVPIDVVTRLLQLWERNGAGVTK